MDHLTSAQLVSILLPIAIIQLVLMIMAVVACVRSDRTRGPKWLWIPIIVFVTTIGPVFFFLFGRKSA